MGVWGGVCAFDEQRFREVVVPAFRTGEHHPMITATLERLWSQGRGLEGFPEPDPTGEPFFPEAPCRFEGLASVLSHVDDAFTTCALGRDFWVANGLVCPPGASRREPGWGYWELVELVEWAILRETVLAWGYLGLAGGSPWRVFGDRVPDRDAPGPSRLRDLLVRLDTTSGYWVHGGGGFGEGLCGWLTATETRELAALLPRPDTAPDDDWQQHHCWTVLDWSVGHGTGLLWGRDLELFYADDPAATLLDPGAPPILRLA
ncbi:hypothetical protein [Nocardia sp. alder85J]|uniref:hypothetical protein n=1 Tax=Nocardia sp. alder85J TaxID=2862949 RepID=UPI001CD810EB|nr:hypothetical protein [Nocardia sp. alder85J]MCX4098571.1 hypothetical protein [Nocardia sp. alder85J]